MQAPAHNKIAITGKLITASAAHHNTHQQQTGQLSFIRCWCLLLEQHIMTGAHAAAPSVALAATCGFLHFLSRLSHPQRTLSSILVQ